MNEPESEREDFTFLLDAAPGYAWFAGISGRGSRYCYGGNAVLDPGERAVDQATLFDLASLTKPLATALVALSASDRGDLDLLEPVSEKGVGSFSILNLLRHDAGFQPWAPLYGKVNDSDDAFDWLINHCPREESGRKVAYSCLGYILLGLILEQKLEDRLDILFERYVLSNLRLKSSEAMFNPDEKNQRRCAATELNGLHEAIMARQNGAVPPPYQNGIAWGEVHDGNARFMGGISGNAGLFATLKGTKVLCSAYCGDTGFLSPAALKLAWESPHPASGERRTAGWKAADSQGWWLSSIMSPGSIGHEGFTGTGAWMAKEGKEIYILLTNRIHPVHPEVDFGPVRQAFVKEAGRAL